MEENLFICFIFLIQYATSSNFIPNGSGTAAANLRELMLGVDADYKSYNHPDYSPNLRLNENYLKLAASPSSNQLQNHQGIYKLNNFYFIEPSSSKKATHDLLMRTLYYEEKGVAPWPVYASATKMDGAFIAISGGGDSAYIVSAPIKHASDIFLNLRYWFIRGSGARPRIVTQLRTINANYDDANVEATSTLYKEQRDCASTIDTKCVLLAKGATVYDPFILYIKVTGLYQNGGVLLQALQFRVDVSYNPPTFDPKPTCWRTLPDGKDTIMVAAPGSTRSGRAMSAGAQFTNANDMSSDEFGSKFERNYQRLQLRLTAWPKLLGTNDAAITGTWERRNSPIEPAWCSKAITNPANAKEWPTGTYLFADLSPQDHTWQVYNFMTPKFSVVRENARFIFKAWLSSGASLDYYLIYEERPESSMIRLTETERSKSNAQNGNPTREIAIPLSSHYSQLRSGDQCKPFRIMVVIKNSKSKSDPTINGDFALFDDFKLEGALSSEWPSDNSLPPCEITTDKIQFAGNTNDNIITNPNDCVCDFNQPQSCFYNPSSTGNYCSRWYKLQSGADEKFISYSIGLKYAGGTNGTALMNEYTSKYCDVGLDGPKILASIGPLAIGAKVWDTDADQHINAQQPKFCAVFDDGTKNCKNVENPSRPGPISSTFSKNDLKCKPFRLNMQYQTQSNKGKIIVDDLKLALRNPTPQLAISAIDVHVCKGNLPPFLKANDGSSLDMPDENGKGHSDYGIKPFPPVNNPDSTPMKPEDCKCNFGDAGCLWRFLDKNNEPLGTDWSKGIIDNPRQAGDHSSPVIVTAPKRAYVPDAPQKVNDNQFPKSFDVCQCH